MHGVAQWIESFESVKIKTRQKASPYVSQVVMDKLALPFALSISSTKRLNR